MVAKTEWPEPGLHLGGPHWEFRFDNGYGASVISNPYSYGGDSGLFELAVRDREGALCYDTPITSDVLGYLTEEKVNETLAAIADLPVAP